MLLEEVADPRTVHINASINGVHLQRTSNVSALFSEGTQASMALFPPSRWRAFDVPSAAVINGNNTIRFSLSGHGGESGYRLVHTGNGGDGQRWHFPSGYEPHSNVSGVALPGASLVQCERLCDSRASCRGVYSDAHVCYALDELEVVRHTALAGLSFERNTATGRVGDSSQAGDAVSAAVILRLELSLTVSPIA